MKRKLTHAAAALTLALAGTQATADAVSLQGTELQTNNLQLMVFNFNGLAPSSGAGATLTVQALGDYNTDFANEVIDFVKLDGTIHTTNLGPLHAGVVLLNEDEYYSESISEAQLDTLLADMQLQIDVMIGAFSGVFTNDPLNRQPYVKVSFTYDTATQAIPEPSTAALLSVALLCAGWTRRRG